MSDDDRPPIVTPAVEMPDVPEGALLRLGPGDWSHGATLPVGTYLNLSLTRIHRNVTRQDEQGLWVWVVGHEHPACTWPHVEAHPPCLQLMVRFDVLTEAANQ
ncbi:hypothetical protein [Plantactinospora sp. B24E8]|uniref:hypothetical protein n=1 Tax=Plantactinospora sp. B24E8 TaxID=3153567 RepID=UPI00325E4649